MARRAKFPKSACCATCRRRRCCSHLAEGFLRWRPSPWARPNYRRDNQSRCRRDCQSRLDADCALSAAKRVSASISQWCGTDCSELRPRRACRAQASTPGRRTSRMRQSRRRRAGSTRRWARLSEPAAPVETTASTFLACRRSCPKKARPASVGLVAPGRVRRSPKFRRR